MATQNGRLTPREAGLLRGFSSFLANIGTVGSRARLAGIAGVGFAGDRDIWTEAGYRTDLEYEHYRAVYDRQDIGGKIVDLPAMDTWRRGYEIRDGVFAPGGEDTSRTDTEFVVSFRALDARVGIRAALSKGDRISGIGRYGVVFLGFDDVGREEWKNPVKTEGERRLVYLRAFAEGRATIASFVRDATSADFGLPETYEINFGDDIGTALVHYSRVLHIADDPIDDEVYGTPRLQRVYNRLYDLLKVVAGSSESFWQTMNRGLHADVRDDAELDPDDESALEEELDEYYHGLRRYIRTSGIDINPLGTDTADPSGMFNVLVSLISAASDIPQRILIGSERGDLASTQDESNWNKVVSDRQANHAEPNILRPLIDRLVTYGVIPAPESGEYSVEWRSLYERSDVEIAEIADKVAGAVQKVAPAGSPDLVITPDEFRTRYLDLPPMLDQIAGEIEDTLREEEGNALDDDAFFEPGDAE